MILSGLTNENAQPPLTPRESQLKKRLDGAYRRGWEDHANIYRTVEPVNDLEARNVGNELRRFDDPQPDPSDEFWILFTDDGNLIEGHLFWTGFDWANDIGMAARIPLEANALNLAKELSRQQFKSYASVRLGRYRNVLEIDKAMPYRANEKSE